MAAARIPANERERLEALRSYEILDTPDEQTYDDLALIASAICQTPIALISLVDQKRQWLKARVGLQVAETSREVAFCAHAILEARPLVVKDARLDARFANNPLVEGDPHIRFYAGVPLINPDGQALGTVCAIDRKPRDLSPEQSSALQALSRQVMTQLELRRDIVRMRAALEQARRPSAESLPATPENPVHRAREIMDQSEEMRARLQELLRTLGDSKAPKRR